MNRTLAQRLGGLPLRGYLFLLVLAVLLPTVAFAGVVFKRYYDSELANIDADLLEDARRMAFTIDRDIVGMRAMLQTLANSDSLVRRDYERFHAQASTISRPYGVVILARSLEGQQLMNTRVPFGTALPFEPLAGDAAVIANRSVYISNLIVGAVAKIPIITMTAPVLESGKVAQFLNLSIFPDRFVALLNEVRTHNRLSGVLDRDGFLIVRIPEQAAYLGKKGPAGFFESEPRAEGLWQGKSISGMGVRSAYATSRASGWVVWVAVPDAEAKSALYRTFWMLAALGLALTTLALSVAYVMGGRLSRSMIALAQQAERVGRGETIAPARFAVREIDEVGRSLLVAAGELQARAGQRDQAERNLRELSGSLERKVEDRTRELVIEMSRREEMETALRQSQKMEAIGQLTGGVAHDFNNMLGVVIGGLDLVKRRVEKGEGEIAPMVDNALEAAKRAAALTQRLLAFARQQPLEPKVIDVNALVAGLSELVRRSLGETIQLESRLGAQLWRINADANQLENVLLNLAVNARDAMPEGGKLTLRTENMEFTPQTAFGEGISPGQYVMLCIGDSGTGMTPEVLAKAFDPFFTTKKQGTGTGLGLSQVYGFVKQSGGHVKIESEPERGTTVKIYLPRHTGSGEIAAQADRYSPIPLGNPGTTILVVEDEAGVRASTSEILRELRYTVVSAESGRAALALLETGQKVDLLFTDVVMPEMNGRKLAEAAMAARPKLKVLFTTGYTRDAIVQNSTVEAGIDYIGKPFTVEQVARKIDEVLKAGGAG
jgi:signal transduction histidine kinase